MRFGQTSLWKGMARITLVLWKVSRLLLEVSCERFYVGIRGSFPVAGETSPVGYDRQDVQKDENKVVAN